MTVRVARHSHPGDPRGGDATLLTRITLDRADKGNSLSARMVDDLSAALRQAVDEGARAVLIDAAGAHFCTGFDLSALEDETDDSLLARFVRVELLLQQLHRAPLLTIALAQGRAWGAGADLFAACTVRWVQDEANFAFPGAGFGLVLGTARLAARVGTATAQDWVASGRRIDAATALDAGLATATAPSAPDAVSAACALAAATLRLDDPTFTAIREAAEPRGPVDDAQDLARLVRSAVRPGLADRVRRYRAASAKR